MEKTINKNMKAEFCYGISYYFSPYGAIVFSYSVKIFEYYQHEKTGKTGPITISIESLCKENMLHIN